MIRHYRATLGLPVMLIAGMCVLSTCGFGSQDCCRAQVIPCAAGAPAKTEAGKAWLGVAVQELNDDLRDVMDIDEDVTGVLVASVTEGSPADKAGIRHGDVIVSVSGEEMETPDDVVKLIQGRKPGSEVVVVLVRDGKKHRIPVVLGKARAVTSRDLEVKTPELRALPKENQPPLRQLMLGMDRGYLGVNVLDLDEELGGYFGVKEGVLVTEVPEGSAGAEAGMRPGDVITAVDGNKVADRKELIALLQKKDEGDETELSLVRKGKPVSLKVKLEKGPFWGWMEGVGDKGEKFKNQFVVPRVEDLKRDADVDRRMDELSKKLEKLEKRLKELDKDQKTR